MHHELLVSLRRLPDDELVARVKDLVARERGATALLVAHLAELDTRDVYLREGHASLFAYCRDALALSEHEAYNRIEAARAARRFPVILDLLAEGAVNLTTVRLLAPHLTRDNHRAVLESARGKRKPEVEEIVAKVSPRPDVLSSIRKLPALAASAAARLAAPVAASAGPLDAAAPSAAPITPAQAAVTPLAGAPFAEAPAAPVPAAAADTAAPADAAAMLAPTPGLPAAEAAKVGAPLVAAVPAVAAPGVAPPTVAAPPAPVAPGQVVPAAAALPSPPPGRSAVVTPLSPDRYKLQVTIGGATLEKLRLAKDPLRHAIPSGDEAAILDRALTALLADLARKKLAATVEPRPSRGTAPGSRHIPAAVRRAAWRRDLGRCAYVGTSGRRCPERAFLELHHVRPYAAGGEATVENVQLRCRRHNDYEARAYFGPLRDYAGGASGTRSPTSSRAWTPGCTPTLDAGVQVKLTAGTSDKVGIASKEENKVQVRANAVLYGNLVVPGAEVHFDSGSKIKGAVLANSISLDAKVKFYSHTAAGF